MKILGIMKRINECLLKGFKSGIIPLAIFLIGLSCILFFGSIGYHIFPTSTAEGKVVKFTKDARSNKMYEVAFKAHNKDYSTFGYVTNEKIEIGQVCKIIYYDAFPHFSKIAD